ncbi:hypothetical protein ZIOFF_001119 [Zingiber officinale]|uniref:S1-like domain-containing protein n=1 Tax=Zingiber officinale TaxID=94328 RepID=A0A8J5HUZ2_ZINOF|nr:hypothetical protein ZIOFF_001119 [Zingiber officinale]
MHKKVWIAAGDIILIDLRDYQDDKADIIFKYMPDEARLLKAYGELPENIRLNEGIGGLDEEDEGGADDYIERDQKVLDGEEEEGFSEDGEGSRSAGQYSRGARAPRQSFQPPPSRNRSWIASMPSRRKGGTVSSENERIRSRGNGCAVKFG